MTRQSFVTDKSTSPAVGEIYRQKHLYEMFRCRKEISRFVKQTVTETRTDKNAYETVNEDLLMQIALYLLFAIELSDNDKSEYKTYQPAQGIPPDG